ncbi:MAG TPA: NAD(P)/FAD-dependent oxidoreductase [Acidimicrobiales bacterium]|jgi:4-hydroxyacetophenone monooxygenase|nr:NAD(P)/FAD-dependent oxidoreductase [Acidimicrobiales bacterium]
MLTDPSPSPAVDIPRLERGLRRANLPALLMVLYQLTGDRRWLEPPYRPHARFGMDPNDSGGFSEEIQEEIRSAARDAIVDWNRGLAPADPRPTGELLVQMMSLVVSEDVPADYEPMLAQQMGFGEQVATGPIDLNGRPDFRVVVIGAGLGGLMTALRLKQAGIPFDVLEMSDHVGGVWWANRYPGAGVDTPSYLYSFSFFPQNWPTFFARRDDVVRYIENFVDHYELGSHIEFETEVTGARWDETEQRWSLTVRSADGRESIRQAPVVVSSVGIFSRPKVPDLPGLDSFEGPIFHSARWPDGLSLEGRHVALVGTGASAMQILPQIVDQAEHITVYQRSPAWVIPVSNYFDEVPEDLHWLFENVPFYYGWYRFSLAWTFNDKLHPTLQVDPDWEHPERSVNRTNDRHRARFTEYIEAELDGRPDLLAKCLPDYPAWGKRMLIDNGWYAALRRDNVELITEGVSEILPHGVRTTGGTERPADIIAMSTGFHTTQYLFPMSVIGRDGVDLREHWNDDDARAYLGIGSPGFPNLFFVYGPNTNGSGGSFLAWSESQVGYIIQLIVGMVDRGLGAIEPKVEVHDRYNEEVDAAHARMIWTHPGLTTYYRNSRGRVVVNVPWTVLEYWSRLRHVDFDDYVTEPVHEPSGSSR